ncbi:MAG: SCO family protein [Flavobacteriales bacterium]|jgi:protein SCO1/2|nr:SCO family protein [Flavobacteriales bacterium]
MSKAQNKGGAVKIIVFIGVLLVAALVAMPMFQREAKLRVFSPADVNPLLVDESLQGKKGAHSIADFSLINQKGELVSKKNFEGKIKIVDFFFTTCTNICPKMTFQMERVNEKFADDNDLVILSHSVTPKEDTPEVLWEYGKEHGAKLPKWQLLTGELQHINDLARKSYFAAKKEWKGDFGDFIHTENFVLVDKEWRIRGYYDGTNRQDINRLMKEYLILKKEYELK